MGRARDRVLLKSLGKRLQRLRKRSGMTQEALAQAAGLHRRYIIKLEMGEGNPTFLVLSDLTRALKIHLRRMTDPS